MYKASKGGNVSEVCKALEMNGVDVNENGFKGRHHVGLRVGEIILRSSRLFYRGRTFV